MINLHHINQRYETALNTHPAKGTPTRKAYLALADSVADVRVLMAEIERLRARLDAARELHYPVEVEPSDTICGECSYPLPDGQYLVKVVEYPCPTIRALGGEQG